MNGPNSEAKIYIDGALHSGGAGLGDPGDPEHDVPVDVRNVGGHGGQLRRVRVVRRRPDGGRRRRAPRGGRRPVARPAAAGVSGARRARSRRRGRPCRRRRCRTRARSRSSSRPWRRRGSCRCPDRRRRSWAGPAQADLVVAVAAVDRVAPDAALEVVVAVLAADRVAARAAVDRVVAGAAEEAVERACWRRGAAGCPR